MICIICVKNIHIIAMATAAQLRCSGRWLIQSLLFFSFNLPFFQLNCQNIKSPKTEIHSQALGNEDVGFGIKSMGP